jgi:hypothetical protein
LADVCGRPAWRTGIFVFVEVRDDCQQEQGFTPDLKLINELALHIK